jgi:hypothetical protein
LPERSLVRTPRIGIRIASSRSFHAEQQKGLRASGGLFVFPDYGLRHFGF